MHGAPLRLRCEYLENPLGLDVAVPRLSWWINDHRPAEIQTAYQILAASSKETLTLDEGDLWDSGRVESRQICQVEYRGHRITSEQRIWWKVRSYDSDGLPSPWSESVFFEMGLLNADAWQADWIEAGMQGSPATSVPVPLLQRQFELAEAPHKARLHIAVLGHAAIQLNGQPVPADTFASSWVDYRQCVEVRSFDVTELLGQGGNTLSVLLADGWFAGRNGFGDRQQYGLKPALLAQLHIELPDGERVLVASDSHWQWRPSWILSADPVTGESVDGRQYLADWRGHETVSTAGRAAAENSVPAWFAVAVQPSETSASISRRSSLTPPVARIKEVAGELIASADPAPGRRLLYRFPHPLFGRARLEICAPEGAVVRVRYSLQIDADGRLCEPVTEDIYTAAGTQAPEQFEATFSLHGFRYVEVSGNRLESDPLAVSAMIVRQDVPVAGEFLCDHPRLNQLHADLAAHQRRLCQGVPMMGLLPAQRFGATDRFGAGAGTLLLNLDAASVCRKWLTDMRDAQLSEGSFPGVVPSQPFLNEAELIEAATNAGPCYSDAFVDVLWALYRQVGDRKALEVHYPAVRRFVMGLAERAHGFIREKHGLVGAGDLPADMSGTCWFYHSARVAAKMAGVLGRLSDLEDFEELASNVRSAFRRRFVTADGRVVADTVAAYALTLGFGMLESTEREPAIRQLVQRCEQVLALNEVNASQQQRKACDLDTLAVVPQLLRTLTTLGRVDLAYRILLGHFDSGEQAADLLAAGVGQWLFAALAGFDLGRDLSEQHNAYRRMKIQPRPPMGVGFDFASYASEVSDATEASDATGVSLAARTGSSPLVAGSPQLKTGGPLLRTVEAALDTINGRYEVVWQITDEAFELSVRIPGNCSAEIILPDDTAHEVDAGTHEFRMAFCEAGDGIPILREVS